MFVIVFLIICYCLLKGQSLEITSLMSGRVKFNEQKNYCLTLVDNNLDIVFK